MPGRKAPEDGGPDRPKRRYVRVCDAPNVWGVSVDTIYKAAKAGQLKIYKPIGVSLLKVTEVDAWVEQSAA